MSKRGLEGTSREMQKGHQNQFVLLHYHGLYLQAQFLIDRLGGFYVKNAAHKSFFTHIVACEVADLSADPNGTMQDLRTLAQKENVPEHHIITVLDYCSGYKQLYRPMEAGERSWNPTDTFMVEVMTLGLKKNLHWQRSMRLDG